MALQGRLDAYFELFWIVGHHIVRLSVCHALRVVSSGPRVVQRRLVRTEVDVHIAFHHALPQVYNVSNVGDASCTFRCLELLGHVDGLIGAGSNLVDPALLVTLVGRFWVDLCGDAHHPSNISCFRLRARHTAQTCSDK
ncbi:MAG: Uncharacterised protein [Cryomorphaceae bacterium]|nr:MAG: Uncharacterised protein [Cryomorphaceae bacterium]